MSVDIIEVAHSRTSCSPPRCGIRSRAACGPGDGPTDGVERSERPVHDRRVETTPARCRSIAWAMRAPVTRACVRRTRPGPGSGIRDGMCPNHDPQPAGWPRRPTRRRPRARSRFRTVPDRRADPASEDDWTTERPRTSNIGSSEPIFGRTNGAGDRNRPQLRVAHDAAKPADVGCFSVWAGIQNGRPDAEHRRRPDRAVSSR